MHKKKNKFKTHKFQNKMNYARKKEKNHLNMKNEVQAQTQTQANK